MQVGICEYQNYQKYQTTRAGYSKPSLPPIALTVIRKHLLLNGRYAQGLLHPTDISLIGFAFPPSCHTHVSKHRRGWVGKETKLGLL